MENREQVPPASENPVLQLTSQMDDYVVTKYRTQVNPVTPEIAKIDATTYASAYLAWFKLVPFIHPDIPEDLKEAKEESEAWDKALQDAEKGDWKLMKQRLQDYARENFGGAAAIETWREKSPDKNILPDEESETLGQSLVNLANSLGV